MTQSRWPSHTKGITLQLQALVPSSVPQKVSFTYTKGQRTLMNQNLSKINGSPGYRTKKFGAMSVHLALCFVHLSEACDKSEEWHSGVHGDCWSDTYFWGSKFTFEMGIIQQTVVWGKWACIFKGQSWAVPLQPCIPAHVDTEHLQGCSAHFFLCSSLQNASFAVRTRSRNGHLLIPYITHVIIKDSWLLPFTTENYGDQKGKSGNEMRAQPLSERQYSGPDKTCMCSDTRLCWMKMKYFYCLLLWYLSPFKDTRTHSISQLEINTDLSCCHLLLL